MTRKVRSCCGWSILLCFFLSLLSPDPALCFDTDTLKTAGIVSGITLGVALVVVLIAGTARDMKRDRRNEDEDDDVWTQSPVLRALGYRPLDDPLFGPQPDSERNASLGMFTTKTRSPLRTACCTTNLPATSSAYLDCER
jgi:hypothetical protein